MVNSDFSHFALWLAGLASVAQAYTTPVGANPSGNPISAPGLNEIVPAGSPYTITWAPTTSECTTVDLVLLRGPSDNIVPLSTIVESAPNSGTYEWTPASTLEPDTTHYGIQLICDQSGAYQYTTQFGISNPGYVSGGGATSSVIGVSTSLSISAGVTSTRSVMLASPSSSSSSASSTSASSAVASMSFPVAHNSTIPHATGTSATLKTTAKPHTSTKIETATGHATSTVTPTETSQAAAPTGTNAASVARAAFGLMGGAAAVVAFVL